MGADATSFLALLAACAAIAPTGSRSACRRLVVLERELAARGVDRRGRGYRGP